MKHKLYFLLLVIFAGLSVSAKADTLTLTGVGGANTNGVYVYPYLFTENIGGKTFTSVPLMCVDFNREITFGETWQVTETAIPTPTDTSLMSIQLRALSLIYFGASTGYGGISASDYQFAAWDIFDPADLVGKSGLTATAQQIASTAIQAASGGYPLPTNFSYSNFALFSPTNDKTGWTDGIPQRFIGVVTPGFQPNGTPPLAPTPEPSGLLLVGTGIFGVAGVMYRRVRGAVASV